MFDYSSRKRKPLVENAGIFKTILVMAFCHASVTLLCVNVMFDLFVYGVPVYILHRVGLLPDKLYYSLTSKIINWTTPIVYGIPMVFSGTKIYADRPDILLEAKQENSLLLSNHGSRIDWMVGMFIGHLKSMVGRDGIRCRVGFVCEALIQMMPLIGWYRKFVCDDVFVWRSFDKDAKVIIDNIKRFHNSDQQRMLFLSPEGVIVDFNERDRKYIMDCREFCDKSGVKSFDYVLTPRYKGTTCLLHQVPKDRRMVSVILVFVRNNKLLNCKLLSNERIVPDIYDLNQGIAGSPVSVYIHLRKFRVNDSGSDTKDILMQEYLWKDSVISEWDKRLEVKEVDEWMSQFVHLEGDKKEVFTNQVAHAAIMIELAYKFGFMWPLLHLHIVIFSAVVILHTLGWLINATSMESVPFETGIKALFTFIHALKTKKVAP